MSRAGEDPVSPDDGRHGSGRGLDASLRLPGLKEAAAFLALVVIGFVVWFAASPGLASMLFGVDLGLWNPDLPLVPEASVACGVVALIGGFVFPRGFYLWGAALALHSPFTQGCPCT